MSDLSATAVGPVTREQISRYADAVDDHNPMHVDEEFAKAAGMPSVIAHGPLTLALAIDALVAEHGAGTLRAFDARLRAPVFPDQALTVSTAAGELELATTEDANTVATAAFVLEEGR